MTPNRILIIIDFNLLKLMDIAFNLNVALSHTTYYLESHF